MISEHNSYTECITHTGNFYSGSIIQQCINEGLFITSKDNEETMPKRNHAFSPTALNNSEVEYTRTLDCFLCSFSLDHKGMFSFNASAKYGESLGCSGKISFASAKKESYSGFGTDFTDLNNVLIRNLNSKTLSFENFNNFSSLFFISSKANCGENNLTPILGNRQTSLKLSDLLISEANMMLASTTKESSIYTTPCLLATASLTSSASSLACFSVNLLFNNILLANENSTSCMNLFNTSFTADLNSDSSLSGTSTFITSSAILYSPNSYKENVYLNVAELKNCPRKCKY